MQIAVDQDIVTLYKFLVEKDVSCVHLYYSYDRVIQSCMYMYIILSKTTSFFSPCSAEDQVAEVYKEFEVAVQVDHERMKRRSQASSDNSSIASRELK